MYCFFKALLIILFMTAAYGSYSFQKPIIPHKIHYVWIGSEELPPSVQKMIASWKKNMPGWEIIRWNEKNCPIHENAYAKNRYENKQFRHVSDYCRAYALEKEGGLYLDTDIYLTHSVEKYLTEPLVFGLEHQNTLSSAMMAMSPHHPFAKILLNFFATCDPSQYQDLPPILSRFFNEYFPDGTLKKQFHQKGKVIVYEPNYLMFNFGGPENVAEHWYSNGSTRFLRGAYYDLYSAWFLNDYAYRLYDETPERHYAILLPDNMYYLIDHKTKRWWFNKKRGTYTLNEDILILKEAKIISVYTCKNRKCVLMKPVKDLKPEK